MIMLKLRIFIVLFLLLVLTPISLARPDKASGVVTRVVDGDTFDVQDVDEMIQARITELERASTTTNDWSRW